MRIQRPSSRKIVINAAICIIFLLFASISTANMCQVIRIEDEKSGAGTKVELYPEKITVPVGTCTVWINWITKGEVQVSFRENVQQCILSSKSPSGFSELKLKEGESCYVSDTLPMGKTASLFWNKPGTYVYTIEHAGSKGKGLPHGGYQQTAIATGIIEVK